MNTAPAGDICDDPDDDFLHHPPWYRNLILLISFDIPSTSAMILLISTFDETDPPLAKLLLPGYDLEILDWLPLNQFFSLLAYILNSLLFETMRIRGVHWAVIKTLRICNILVIALVQQPVIQFFPYIGISSLLAVPLVCLHFLLCVLYWLGNTCASFFRPSPGR